MTDLFDFGAAGSGEFLGISFGRYFWMAIAITGGFVLSAGAKIAINALLKLTAKTKTNFDDLLATAVRRPIAVLVAWMGIYLAVSFVPEYGEAALFRQYGLVFCKLISIAIFLWLAYRMVDALTEYSLQLAGRTESKLDDQLIPIARTSAKVFLGVVGVIWVLQSMGYSISGLLAGMGIGGMALALAAKDTLSNFFGSILVFLDKPFTLGDWIVVAGTEGTVEEIGLRTTKIRTFGNSIVTVPNSTLTVNAVENWSRMQKRRIKMTIGITYAANVSQVKEAVEAIKEIIKTDERFRQDFYLVNFTDFGASSLDIFVYCFSKTTIWADYLKLREEFNLRIMEAFQKIGVEFAFPSQSLYFDGDSPLKLQGTSQFDVSHSAGSKDNQPRI